MTTDDSSVGEHPDSLDRIALDLQDLRENSGPVSYAELVRRISDLRLQRGVRAAAATPARSTVYNAFRTARSRMDPELLRDIVVALGADDAAADAWVQRYRTVTVRRREAGQSVPEPPSAAQPVPRASRRVRMPLLVGILCACIVVNLLGLSVTAIFDLSVYLDMIGTAIAALALGPWHGVVVAVASSGLGFVTGDPHTWEFAPVNMVGALVWGYGVRRFRLGASLGRFTSLNLLTALACSLVAAPIVVMVFQGGAGHASERSMLALEAMQLPFVASVFSANIVTSATDKLLTGFIALFVFTLLHRSFGVSAQHMPLVEKIAALRSGDRVGALRAVGR
ncbi:ECF transporter S component [Microbacterium sp. UFMG61]|uniref:ECF transporter S component n=1 Tax=Microbacterium sp. UFMG61 TaxID=2745935 RepID=UPI00188EDBA4|nr:ECF transporter S component [Microbacterium sp. UFMG61]